MSMLIKGKVWKFGDDINTDLIIAGKHKLSITDLDELSKHTMEAIDPKFAENFVKGDLVVAGRNFGCGSSREQAPLVLKHIGVGAVIARSFARIFCRNSINIGLPAVESRDIEKISDRDLLHLDLAGGTIRNLTKEEQYQIKPIPPEIWEILSNGGLVSYVKKYSKLPW